MNADTHPEQFEPAKSLLRFRISSMIWLVAVVAAFLGGRVWEIDVQDDLRTPIALAGSFDIDGDGVDDSSKLSQMIEKHGGRVVHDVDDSTRFLVLGKMTDSQRDASEDIRSARKNRVIVVTVRELFGWLAIKGSKKVVRDIHSPFQRGHQTP